MRNIKLELEYDGARYCGWQRQLNGTSIQQVLEEKIQVMIGGKVKLIGSGRTDAGAHALKQVANFSTDSRIPPEGFLLGLNSLLPEHIAVKSVAEVRLDFHSRYSALRKTYLYRILNAPSRQPLERLYAWHIKPALDVSAIKECLPHFHGRHDFAAFMAAGSSVKTTEREITNIFLDVGHKTIELEISADGFLRHMVRNIVGTLVEAGLGKRRPDSIYNLLEKGQRSQAGPTAPAHGLFLKDVLYPDP